MKELCSPPPSRSNDFRPALHYCRVGRQDAEGALLQSKLRLAALPSRQQQTHKLPAPLPPQLRFAPAHRQPALPRRSLQPSPHRCTFPPCHYLLSKTTGVRVPLPPRSCYCSPSPLRARPITTQPPLTIFSVRDPPPPPPPIFPRLAPPGTPSKKMRCSGTRTSGIR